MDGCRDECELIRDRRRLTCLKRLRPALVNEAGGWKKAREQIQYYQACLSTCNPVIMLGAVNSTVC